MTKRNRHVFCLLAGPLLMLPTVSVFSQRGSGIRSADFTNFTFHLGDERGFGDESVTLRNGKFESPDNSPGGIVGGKLVTVRYADFDGDSREEAAVEVNVGVNGSAGSLEHYFVFVYRDGAPRQIFHESREGGRKMTVIGRSLVFSAPFWRSNDAHCCPSALATETYVWRRSKFVRASRRLRPLR